MRLQESTLFDPITWRTSFCARKFTSLVAFEHENMPNERVGSVARAAADAGGGSAVGLFSCSKATNEVNFLAQKLARVALGTNNVDSCNRT